MNIDSQIPLLPKPVKKPFSQQEYDREKYKLNRETQIKQATDWRNANREKHNANRRAYCKANRKKILAERAKWLESHSEENKLRMRNYAKQNRAKFNAHAAKRKAKKLERTPAWADLKAIELFYRNCPIGYEVDHIIPLQGKNVSGLHVPNNLQYLTKLENIRKGNRYVS